MARDETAIVQLQVRLREDLRRSLEQAAQAKKISLNQEIVDRLEYVRDRQNLLSEVLRLTFGDRLGALLMALGFVMDTAGRFTRSPSWNPFRKDWTDQPDLYDHAIQAAVALLEAARPTGAIPVYKLGDREPGPWLAGELIDAIRGKNPEFPCLEQAEEIKRLLGPIADRLGGEKSPQPVNPYLLAIAVMQATSDVDIWSKNQELPLPAGPIISILEKHLKEFLRNDWQLRQLQREVDNEGQHRPSAAEELAAELKRRA